MKLKSKISQIIYIHKQKLEGEDQLILLEKNNTQHYLFNNNNKNTNSILPKAIN